MQPKTFYVMKYFAYAENIILQRNQFHFAWFLSSYRSDLSISHRLYRPFLKMFSQSKKQVMVGSSNMLRKIGGKLEVNTCYVLTADVTIDSFVFKRSISRKLLIIIIIIR